jgi:hypothetical protein
MTMRPENPLNLSSASAYVVEWQLWDEPYAGAAPSTAVAGSEDPFGLWRPNGDDWEHAKALTLRMPLAA